MRKVRRDPHAVREAVALVIACVVAGVWVVTQLASVFFNKPVDGQVHVIMLAVVTALLGTAAFSARKSDERNGNGGNGKKPPSA